MGINYTNIGIHAYWPTVNILREDVDLCVCEDIVIWWDKNIVHKLNDCSGIIIMSINYLIWRSWVKIEKAFCTTVKFHVDIFDLKP